MAVRRESFRFCTLALILLLTGAMLPAGAAWNQEDTAAKEAPEAVFNIPANELVARVVNNELNAPEECCYMFRDRRQTSSGTVTKEMIETSHGLLARTIAWNDKPLTAEQRASDDARLDKLVADPEAMREKHKEQKEDNDRVMRMLKELPRAFLYQYDGTEQSENGTVVRLKFTPALGYDPPSRETSAFKAMSGTLWINAHAERLVRIHATLFRDVAFGWGILGHLDKGGHIFLEQSKIADRRWEPTKIDLKLTGKILFFKTLRLNQVETTSNFRRVPESLSVSQAVEMLKKSPVEVAESIKGEAKPNGK